MRDETGDSVVEFCVGESAQLTTRLLALDDARESSTAQRRVKNKLVSREPDVVRELARFKGLSYNMLTEGRGVHLC